MLYITGDIHGNQYKWVTYIDPVLKENDILFVTGDFGFGFFDGMYNSETGFFDWIEKRNYIVCFIDGNHENFDVLNALPIQKWNGGNVHFVRKNIIHLMRGEIYDIENHSFFVFGGGYSMDRLYRKEGISWWKEELPNQKEFFNAHMNLNLHRFKVDYVLTHSAPSDSIFYLQTFRHFHIKNMEYQEAQLDTFLESLTKKIEYSHWYFGHFHVDLDIWKSQTALFNCIRNIFTNEIVQEWDFCDG